MRGRCGDITNQQAKELIHRVACRGSRPGLARVRELLHRLGDPQDGLQFVHIAGTNGKGSTAAMLASILRAAGYTTGLFTSPYLERFAERMQVNGVPVPDAEFAAVCEALQPCIAAMDDPPTEFELVTAAAMLWFRRRGCDVVVLEVGLGGRLDATNVIAAPACAVITNIGDAHIEFLGSREGILKAKSEIFENLDADGVAIQKTPTVLDELLDAVLVKFRKRYPDIQVELETPDAFIVIPMDSMLIQQVLTNLLENAVLHAKGMTRLTLRVFTLGSRAVFEVKDDGCGIPKERLRTLFSGTGGPDPNAPADSGKHGMGIGLSVCAAIIKAHGGEIDAESRPGEGTTIRFWLETEKIELEDAEDEQ